MLRICALALILTTALLQDAAASLPCFSETHHYDQVPPTLKLSRNNVIPGSVRILLNGELLAGNSYAVDRRSGTIKFINSPAGPATVVVTYSRMWFDIPEYFARRKLGGGASVQRAEMSALPGPPADRLHRQKSESSLRVFGSKSIGLSAGTGTDMDLKQTLNINIDGYLTKDLRVSGVLSDQSRPEIGGISTSIGEVDKISLQLTSQHFGATVGDIDFNRRIGRNAELRKSLKGGTVSVQTGDVASSATVGGIKSKHGRFVGNGRDGVSGPYKLIPSDSYGTVSIIPGTERVWLDGRELERGSDADYQIDYLLGELRFPPTILITSQTRIESDFEYLNENYRQDFMAGAVGFGDSVSHVSAVLEVFRQEDSYGNPSRFSLAETDLATLAAAGDSSDSAVRSGVSEVDSGSGNYVRDVVGVDTIYVFVGENAGSLRVSFSHVGQGEGDYNYIGGGVYDFVGRGAGAYLPIVTIPLPERSDAASLSTRAAFDRIDFRANMTVSDWDRNTVSTRNDENNLGSDFSAAFSALPMKSADSTTLWAVDVEGTRKESEFHLPGRTFEPEWGRYWGLQSDTVYSVAEHAQIGQRLRLSDRARASLEYGGYRDRGHANAERYSLGFGCQPLSELSVDVMRSDRLSEDNVAKRNARLFENRLSMSAILLPVRLGVSWNDELDNRKADSVGSGKKFDKYSFTGGIWGLNAGVTYDDHKLLTESWTREYDSRTTEIRYDGSGWLRDSKFGLSLIHRRVHREIPNASKESQLAIATDYRAGSAMAVFDLSLNYRINREGTSRAVENFVRVGKGEGDYRFENGVYVPDDLGDYIRVEETLAAEETGVLVARYFSLYTRLANWSRCPQSLSFLRILAFESSVKSSEQGSADERFSADWLVPFAGLFERTRYGFERSIRQTVRAALDKDASMFLSLEEERSERRMQPSSRFSYSLTLVERGDVKLSRFVQLTAEHRFRRIDQDSRSFGSASFTEHHLKPSLKYFPISQIEIVIKPSYLIDRSRNSDLVVRLSEAASDVNLRFAGAGRLNLRAAFQSVSSSDEGAAVPYQFALGRRVGENSQWGASIDLRMSESLSVGLSYDGENIPMMDVRHMASATAKARF
jgi:hypothetical protein